MIKIRSKTFYILLSLSAFILVGVIVLFTFGRNEIRITPSYTVANRWELSKFRHIDLSELEGRDSLLISYTLASDGNESKYLAFKSTGYNITAFTSGKMLYQSYHPERESYNLISLDSLNEGDTVILKLIPCSKGGKILSNPIIASPTELFIKLINTNKSSLVLCLILFAISFSLLLFLLTNIIKNRRLAKRNVFIFVLSLSLFALLFAKCDIALMLFDYSKLSLIKTLCTLSATTSFIYSFISFSRLVLHALQRK